MDNAYIPRTQKALSGNILAWVLGVTVVVVLIGVGGWQLNWWLRAKSVNRQAHILRSSYGNQQTLRDQITTQIGNVLTITTQIAQTPSDAQALKAQRLAVLAIVCNDADQVTGDPLPLDQQQFVQANCEAGNVNPSSIYNH